MDKQSNWKTVLNRIFFSKQPVLIALFMMAVVVFWLCVYNGRRFNSPGDRRITWRTKYDGKRNGKTNRHLSWTEANPWVNISNASAAAPVPKQMDSNKQSNQHVSGIRCATEKETSLRTGYPQDFKYKRYVVRDAVRKGALCLDGSPAVFFHRRGQGDGKSKWVIFFDGGAWCSMKSTCLARSKTFLGSSKYSPPLTKYSGLLSNDRNENAHFFNWNIAFLQYCDGASFAGNRSEPFVQQGKLLYSRGRRIVSAVLEELLQMHGLKEAQSLLVAGVSSGGLAVLINADYIRSYIPSKLPLYLLVDGAFFLDIPCANGQNLFGSLMRSVFTLHDLSDAISRECSLQKGKHEHWRCVLPENLLRSTTSHLFLVHSLCDSWQLVNTFGVPCGYAPRRCSPQQNTRTLEFYRIMVDAFKKTLNNRRLSLFLHRYVAHVNIVIDHFWNEVTVGKSFSMSEVIFQWFNSGGKHQSYIDKGQCQISP